MERLFVEQKKSTPEIDFDPVKNTLSIKGQSYPEDTLSFYKPIFKWIEEYLEQLEVEALIEINLLYMNTSSTKCVMNIIDIFENAYENGKKIAINWYCDFENENSLECAEEFKEDVSFPFNIIPLESEE